MSGNQLHFEPGTGSDVGNPPSIEKIAQAMRTSRFNRPKALELEVHATHFGWEEASGSPDDDIVTILVVPTALRVTYLRYVERFETPEFEFEGWVLGPGESPWVRGALRTNNEGEIEECTIYVLEPGKELGVERTPGIH
jgi:hypothetical protein